MEANADPVRVGLLDPQRLMRETLCSAFRSDGLNVVGEYASAEGLLSGIARDQPAVVVISVTADLDAALIPKLHQFLPGTRVLAICDLVGEEVSGPWFAAGAAGWLDRSVSTCLALASAIRATAHGERVVPIISVDRLSGTPKAARLDDARLSSLSIREREVLTYISGGDDNMKIAALLSLSERTVKAHVSSLYRKLAQENRTQLALYARQLGVRPGPESH